MLTGFPELDHLTGGLAPGSLTLLAADSSVGKTSFALNLVANAARNNKTVMVHSLEMNKTRLIQRLLASSTHIPVSQIANGDVKAEDWPKLVRAVAELHRYPLYLIEPTQVSFRQMRELMRDLKGELSASQRSPLSLMIVDYLQLLLPFSFDLAERQRHVEQIVKGFKRLARDFDIPVVLVAQLESDTIRCRHDRRPVLADLAGLEPAEQDTDMVMFLYRDEYYNPDSDDKGIAEVIIGKHRNGPTGKVQLAWMERCGLFASLARQVKTA